MEIGSDTIVVEWKARTSEMHAAMARLREDSKRTRAEMGGSQGTKAQKDDERWNALKYQRWLNADKRYQDRLAADRAKSRQRETAAQEKQNAQNAAYQMARMKWAQANADKIAKAERWAADLTLREQRRVQDGHARSIAYRHKELAWEGEAARLTAKEQERVRAAYARSTAYRRKQLEWEREAARLTAKEQERVRGEYDRSVAYQKRLATETGSSVRRRIAQEHSAMAVVRAEKNLNYELAKGHRWLKGAALQSFRDQTEAAKKLHAQRVAEAKQLADAKQRTMALTDADRKLAQSYREIASDARKVSTDNRLRAGPGGWADFTTGFFKFVSWIRAVRYLFWVVRDLMAGVGRAAMFVVNAFVAVVRTWTGVVGTALKFGAAVGTAVVGALALATKQATDFEAAMLRVGGVLSQQLKDMPLLEQAVRAVAKAYGMTPSETSVGAFQLASYGYGQKQTAQMLPGVALLARSAAAETGGTPDFNRAAETIGRVLMVWKKDGREAVSVANAMAAANAYSAATFERLYTSMPKAAQAANLVRMSFEETVATLSQLNNAGLDATQAGAALLGLIVRLIAPTEKFKKIIESHGVAYRTVNPAIVGFRRALQNLVSLGLDPTEVAEFRNRNGLLAMNILLQQGVAQHDRLTRAVTGTRKAEEQSAIMLSSVSAKRQLFMASLRDFAITLTEKIRPALGWFLDQLRGWIDWFASTPEVRALAAALGQMASGLAQLVVRLLKLIDVRKHWREFVAATTGYLRIAAQVITTAFGIIEYVIRSVVDENSPLRKLWSGFWEFVVWSLKQAGGFAAGALSAFRKILDNFFGEDANKMVSEWGTTFVALIAETMKQSAVVLTRGLAKLSASIADWWDYSPWSLILGPGVGAGFGAGALALNKVADITEKEDTSGIVRGAGRSIAEVLRRNMGTGGSVFSGAWTAFKQGRSDFMDAMGNGPGLPVTNMVRQTLNGLVEQWAAVASDLKSRGQVVGGAFDDASRQLKNFVDGLGDVGDEAGDAGDEVRSAGDRIDGMISKVIGAPLELLQKITSPVTFGRRMGAGGIGNLLGMGPMQTAAEKQERAADTQLQAATIQQQVAQMQSMYSQAFMAGGAYAGGSESVARSLSARGITRRRGTRVSAFLPVQGDYFWPATWGGAPRGFHPSAASSGVNTGAGGGGDFYRGVPWGSKEHRAMAWHDYNEISREREAITLQNQMALLGKDSPEAQAARQSVRNRFQADRERMRRHFGPIIGAFAGPASANYGADRSKQAVDVYVHFDQDTLKPGVNKVVQRGVQQLIPALQGY